MQNDSLEFQFLNEIGIIDQLAQASAQKLLAPKLNMAQFIVLNHLARRAEAASLVSMANAIQVTKGAMTNTVSRLEEKGYVSVDKDPTDGRGKQVSLTTAGQSVRDDAVKKISTELQDMTGVLTPAQLEKSLVYLRKIRVWLDARRD